MIQRKWTLLIQVRYVSSSADIMYPGDYWFVAKREPVRTFEHVAIEPPDLLSTKRFRRDRPANHIFSRRVRAEGRCKSCGVRRSRHGGGLFSGTIRTRWAVRSSPMAVVGTREQIPEVFPVSLNVVSRFAIIQ